jgi:hypothetical protein
LRLRLLAASCIGEMSGWTWSGVGFARKVIPIIQGERDCPKTLRMTAEMKRLLSGLTRGIGEAPVFLDAKMVLRHAHNQPEDPGGALGAVEREAHGPVNER